MKVRPFSLVVALLLCACPGRGAIFLTVEGLGAQGPLKIPDDVDRLSVTVATPDGATSLFEKEYALAAGQQFPLTLGLEPGPKTPDRVRIAASAFKGDQPVAEAVTVVPLNPQEVTSVTMRLVKE
jgi:hypothetical protein